MNPTRIKSHMLWAVPLGIAFLCVPAMAQQSAPPPADGAQKTIKSTAQEVVLDVVARDKKGRPLKDLTADDFEVTDNGQKQTIKSFRLIEGNDAIEKGAKVQLDPLRQLRLVTICFRGGLGVDGKRNAMGAINDLLKGAQAPNTYYSIVMINSTLNVLQPFTKDQDLLRKAAQHAIEGLSAATYNAESSTFKNQLQSALGPLNGMSPTERIAQMGSGSGPNAVGDIVNASMARMMLNMTQFDETITDWDRLAVFSLLSLVRGQTALPGRKTVIFFTEGLHIPEQLDVPFNDIIKTANRANVSVYPIDPRGLNSSSENKSGMDMLSDALSNSRRSTQGSGAVDAAQAKAQDEAQESMRSNDRNAMAALAEGTGGDFVYNTNDIRSHLKKLNEDMYSYYEITYNPGIENFDGSFRKTSVDVHKKDVKLQARNGYYALPLFEGGAPANTLQPFELPLLKVIDAGNPVKDIEVHAAALHMQPEANGNIDGSMIMEVPMKNVKFTEDPAKKTYKARISMLALLKDSNNTVVKKFSQDIPVSNLAADKLPLTQHSDFRFMQNFSVPAGKYTLYAAVLDRESDKLGMTKTTFDGEKKSGVAISDVTMVRSYEPQAKGLTPDDPFQFQGGKVMPTLNEKIKAEKGAILRLFFTVYPDKSMKDKPQLNIAFMQNGQVLQKAPLPLPEPDSMGRIPYTMSIPADALPPGTYEIHAIAEQGSTKAEEKTTVVVE